jgi:hypothetical protein
MRRRAAAVARPPAEVPAAVELAVPPQAGAAVARRAEVVVVPAVLAVAAPEPADRAVPAELVE